MEWHGIIDDYGHHPFKIAAVLRAARESIPVQVIAVVQPHRYTRLRYLFEQFPTCFNDADFVISPGLCGGRAPIEGWTRTAWSPGGIKAHGHRQVQVLPSPERHHPA